MAGRTDSQLARIHEHRYGARVGHSGSRGPTTSDPVVSGIRRRAFLGLGFSAFGGLSLPGVLQLRAHAGTATADTAVIFVTLGGGPSQFETYDPKPDAPVEYRGPFHSLSTRLPGVSFCELLPRHAAIADRLAVVRSMHHEQASHIALHIVETGYDLQNSANARRGEMPSVGSVVSKVRGPAPTGIPNYVSIPRLHAYAGAHWLGAEHGYFAVNGDPNEADFAVDNLAVSPKLTADRLGERRRLLSDLERPHGALRRDDQARSLDAFGQQAFDLVTGTAAQRAFDVDREDPRLRDRYGRNTLGQRMLLARRLVEAGVPFVSVRMGGWDDHQQLPRKIGQRAPQYDAAVTALIDDLEDRGLRQRVLVVAMGEFGRTPRVNPNAGRDHYPAVNSVLFAGGDFRMGQVIGATDRNGLAVTEAPCRPQNALSMVYRHLGIDPALTFDDYAGRPRYVLEERRPIRELL